MLPRECELTRSGLGNDRSPDEDCLVLTSNALYVLFIFFMCPPRLRPFDATLNLFSSPSIHEDLGMCNSPASCHPFTTAEKGPYVATTKLNSLRSTTMWR